MIDQYRETRENAFAWLRKPTERNEVCAVLSVAFFGAEKLRDYLFRNFYHNAIKFTYNFFRFKKVVFLPGEFFLIN